MRVPGWKTARHAGRWARSRLTGAALILGYHRVVEASRDPYGLCVSPAHFDEQMEVLRTQARPAPLTKVMDEVQRGVRVRGSVAVTFDDGYGDFARNAGPVLQRHAIPATVFAISGLLGRRPWWDELARLVLDAPRSGAFQSALDAADGDRPPGASFDWSERARQAALTRVHRTLLGSDARHRQRFLDRLREVGGAAADSPAGDEIMDADELARVSRLGLVEVGSHTVNHLPLAAVPEHEQRYEIGESHRQLETITGRPVRLLSYPHGSNAGLTRQLARQSGYRLACASHPDAVARASDPFCLPRFWVPDWDGDRFARWLHRWRT